MLWVPQGNSLPTLDDAREAMKRRGAIGPDPWLWDNLIGFWPMIERGGLIAHDFSGYGHHGTLTNMAPASDWVDDAHIGGVASLDCDGVDDYIYAPALDIDLENDGWTLAFWYKSEVDALYERVLNVADGNYGLQIINDNGTAFHLGNSDTTTATRCTLSTVPAANEWHYVVGTKQQSAHTYYFYLDGEDKTASGTVGWSHYPTAGTWFGQRGNGQYAHCRFGSIAFFNREFSPAEVRWLYRETLAGYPTLLHRGSTRVWLVGSGAGPIVWKPWLVSSAQIIGGGVV